ncbi:MAG: DUF1444 family protein [Planctomycetaceae bacterium]|nr:DUF1444 family protein [Planctomycetaceae bacterium]
MDSHDHSDDTEPQYVSFQGPANWFSFDVPTTLQLEQSEAFLEIRPQAPNDGADDNPEPGWSMTMYAAWVDESEPEKSASSFEASALFPGVITSTEARRLELPGRCRTWQGMSRGRRLVPWWKQMFKPSPTYEWRLWVVEFREIMIVASLQSPHGRPLSAATVNTCEQMLNSILFAEVFACPPMLFRQQVIELAEKHFPLLEVKPTGSFSVSLDGSEINLSNFYRSYIHSPERLKDIVLPGMTAIVRLHELGPEQLMPELPEARERIMPMLYPEADADESMSEFVQAPWVGGLTVMYVLDEEESYRFVHERMLTHWRLSREQLHDLAMQNLQVFADENPLEVSLVGDEDDARMLVPVNPSPYNSVRLLGEQLHGRLRQVLGAELIVGVPNRDFFVAVSLNHPELIGQIQKRVVQDYQSMHHPLTSRLLVISADGVSEYCEL